jgi:hypothetical protein
LYKNFNVAIVSMAASVQESISKPKKTDEPEKRLPHAPHAAHALRAEFQIN